MSRVSSLYRIQELDLALAAAHARANEILAILADVETIRRLQREFDQAEANWKDAYIANASADNAVTAQREKISHTERTLYSGSVSNPKVLQDHQQESESLQRYLITLEDRLLEAMIDLENKENAREHAARELERAKADRSSKHQALVEEQALLENTVQRLEGEREAALADVPESDLKIYEQLRSKLGERVLSIVELGSCNACGLELASSILQSIKSGSEIIRCRQCSRILYAG